ncbi:MAG: response regulator [Nitrospinaceae bacterium]|nr:response regulator [Nitrospinaceae bacterium]NIS88270.1 response regulator [Nitrospinaceae bacterium]
MDTPEQARTPQAPREDEPPLKILLADDAAMNLSMATKLFTRKGHTVVGVENGRAALDAFRNDSFDVVLMDIQMPVMDGLEATRQIRNHEKTQAQKGVARFQQPVPIVGVTAGDEELSRETCLQAGMDGVIYKPLDIKTVLPTLREILRTLRG